MNQDKMIFNHHQSGRIVTICGEQYFIFGKNRIKVSEHFSDNGKIIDDLLIDVIKHTADTNIKSA